MKLSKLKKKVEDARNRSQGNKNILLLEDDKINEIRLLPNKELGEDQFKSIYLHYRQGRITPKTMISPKTYGEMDAVELYVSEILNEGRVETDYFKALKNMEPTETFITTAVLRGKEKEGAKLWVLTIAQFEGLVDLLEANDIQDVSELTDPKEGYDIKVKVISKEKSENNQRQVKFVAVARDKSPVHKDSEVAKSLLENQPSWEEAYSKVSNDELKRLIETYESGDDPEELEDTTVGDNTSEKDVSSEEEDKRLKDALADFEDDDSSEVDDDFDKLGIDDNTDDTEGEKKKENASIDEDDPF